MCSVDKYLTTQEEEMTIDEVSKIIAAARKQFGIKKLVLTGGEPLLLKDVILQIAPLAREQGMTVIFTTNGFYLEGYAEQLARSGISHFHVSLDGLEKTHNYIRRNDLSFEKAANGIRILADLRQKFDLKYSIGIAMVLLKANVHELHDLFLEADSLGADVMDILPYLPDNTDFSNIDDTVLWPDTEDMDKYLKLHKRIFKAKKGHIRINASIDSDLMAKYYNRKMLKSDWQCMAGFKNIFITMSDPKRQGKFEPCVFMCKAHIPVRDHDHDLKKIWHSAEAYAARRDIKGCDSYCYQPCFSLPSVLKLLRVR